ncbi:MAG: DUF4407 domain-containing protein, partial [Saprospiraceae bacterium]|nr:DUF4407 domain-containing protein [Saprospiraceae bacterium]
MTYLRDFFLLCSGANESILKKTPTEINRFVGIGATIFFTGVFAAIASAYAIHTVFNNYFISMFFGLLWGLMIFNLDRYIVSTIKKKGSFFRDLSSVVPRLVLAILIAVVIAKPLELKVFETEIEAEIQLMQQETYAEQEALLKARYDSDIQTLNTDIASLEEKVEDKRIVRDQLDKEAILEADGTGGSMRRNMGPIYAIKKADAQKAQAELDATINEVAPLIENKQAQLATIEKTKADDLASMQKVALTGLASRIEALDRLSNKSTAIFYAGIFIMLLFIAIETSPIFVKLIAERSPYDFVLNKHEFAFRMNHNNYVAQLENATTNKIKFDTETGLYKTEIT